jgi:DNA-binding transcriptional LysR family regulator
VRCFTSLSKQLRNLEETYKIKLFVSNHKGIQLTEDGVEFLRYVEPILEHFHLLQARFSKSRQTKLDKHLRIGGSFALSANYLPSIIGTFSKRYPQVEVILRSNGTSALEKMLIAGAVEIVFTSVPTQSLDLTAEPCMRMK